MQAAYTPIIEGKGKIFKMGNEWVAVAERQLVDFDRNAYDGHVVYRGTSYEQARITLRNLKGAK